MLYVVVAKALVLFAGTVILFYTVKAARRTQDKALWILSLGLAFTGSGLFLTGLLSPFLGIDGKAGLALTSMVAAIGLIIVVYSMYTDEHVPTGE